MKGRIYRIKNKINGKSYIGQTQRTVEKRFNRHLKDSLTDNYIFHKALIKYGAENFEIEILEDDVDSKFLDEREIYWIEKFHTYINDPLCNGYNMTRGGDSLVDVIRILTDDEIKSIRKLLKENILSQDEISKKFNVSYSTISDINRGRSWYDKDISYPIRDNNIKDISYNEFLLILEMLESHLFSQNYIEEYIGLNSSSIISNINTGKYKKYSYPKKYMDFPLNKDKTVSLNKKITVENSIYLLIDYLNTSYTRKELALKYDISESYVKSLISTKGKPYLKEIKYPIKDNKAYNLDILNNKLKILQKYKLKV